MSIIINLSVILADKNIKSKDLAKAIGITEQNLSILKNNKAKAIRFSTLEAICKELDCQPGDIIKFKK
ncbi:helix-turn-helix domain-containing protein [Francisella adeliensis]|uniref:Transcriptional regulator n=1 Tax=Francisella adeliensis TaxID=2007306 RepID=A0A2Z4XYA5_9GAMM|nr:helix-turn-helix transcriptional regulator [Francisella adeliensis]AXA33730.1 transcriptional regulator [Francisella adeliensis]MBK2085626.1 helix-turn-helix transcriptional regulator [Francisella adeliensis]MBK2097504.1 helix-turn-helix transcriptional regulator [Francisella adeliensis]QIW11964.1 helix-turn-helix transcriptional regulator [Francisella adeliensis]QIW13840.1 helix-turn-helix transcriptional regulator [Francisella adeliensis]